VLCLYVPPPLLRKEERVEQLVLGDLRGSGGARIASATVVSLVHGR
jgi:hypothetical protein